MLPFTLQQLRILKAVGREKSLTKAAKLLYLSQPLLSKQMKALEQNIGITILNRENNKISLTENGTVFLQYAERILTLCEESCRAITDLKNGERGNLTVGASQTIGIYLMPRVLALFAQTYPQISLNVQVSSTRIIAKNLRNREIDIAIVGGAIPEEFKKNLKIEDFVEDELTLIVSKSHPFVKKKNYKKRSLPFKFYNFKFEFNYQKIY
jgi:DNA-binding transcriptional LysR family regulator